MMGKTHLAIGIATSLVVMNPTNSKECVLAVVGGAIGGVAADIDILDNDYKHDALIGQLLALGISGIALLMDYVLKLGICQYMMGRNTVLIGIGVVAYLILLISGFISDHRTFTHSLIALLLFSLAIYFICPIIALAYFVGYFSHLLLDFLNKKKIPLLYPKGKGICFKLCYANKTANTVFMYSGLVLSAVFLINALVLRVF